MWLLNTLEAKLKYFSDDALPVYAIVSHVWDETEPKFEDFLVDSSCNESFNTLPAGCSLVDQQRLPPSLSPKVSGSCKLAAELGYYWVWLDTCCIDKRSSSELSEAINSMFSWYSKASLCIAYLADVPDDTADPSHPTSRFRRSKWFTRGWTLQELIAPPVVLFVSHGWIWFGMKANLAKTLEEITGIDAAVLNLSRKVSDVSVADRMRWASNRNTTRVEDKAYSLQGLFNINMPPLYGEGAAAFRRLQQEIMKISTDQTLFVWKADLHNRGLLAQSSVHFSEVIGMTPLPDERIPSATSALCAALTGEARNESNPPEPLIESGVPTFTVSNHGVLARVPLIRDRMFSQYAIAVLAVQHSHGSGTPSCVGLLLRKVKVTGSLFYYEVMGERTVILPRDAGKFTTFDRKRPDANGGERYGPPGWTDLTVKWENICIPTHSSETLHAHPIDRVGATYLVVPHWVLAKVRRRGFFLESDSLDSTSRDPQCKILLSQSAADAKSTLVFTYDGKHRENAEEGFRVHLRGFIKRVSKPSSPNCLEHLHAGVTFNSTDVPPKGNPISGWVENGCARSRSFRDGERCVTLTFSPWNMEGYGLHFLDINLSGLLYARHTPEDVGAALEGSARSNACPVPAPKLGAPPLPSQGSHTG